jgi:hypothetical protein
MEEAEVTTKAVVSAASGQILSGPEDSIFDDIFDWIQNAIDAIPRAIRDWFWGIWNTLKDQLKKAFELIISPIKTAMDWVKSHVGLVWDRVRDIYSKLSDWVKDAWDIVSSAVSSVITRVRDWIVDTAEDTWDWVTRKVGEVRGWLTTTASNIITAVTASFAELRATVTSFFSDLWAKMEPASAGFMQFWTVSWPDWWRQRGEDVSGIIAEVNKVPGWLHEHIADPITDWFKETWADFKEWFWEKVGAAKEWFTQMGSWFVEIFTEKVLTKVWNALGWVWDKMTAGIQWLFDQALNLLSHIAPLSPEGGTGALSGMANIGIVMGGGLAAMTIGGHFCHPLQSIGLGQVAAMVYDMSNYKLVLGAFMGAVAATAIRTPITYYLNSMLRPWILDRGSFGELMSRKAFTDPEALQNPDLIASVKAITKGDGKAFEDRMIGYYGHPATYYGFYKELAIAPLRYFPLAGIARTGFFEPVWFTEALHRSGYSKTGVDALMVMYRKMADESARGMMSGAAVTRFKEGFTNEKQFQGEMAILGYSDIQFKTYLAAAKIDYATDYTRDLLTAYRDAVRKGHIGLDGYREALLGLGMVPERVEGYILQERARLKPSEALTPIAPATPVYETDAGKIIVDTVRRQRRKLLISRDQEIVSLVGLGMEPEYAKAVADNDDVRLAEKGGEE